MKQHNSQIIPIKYDQIVKTISEQLRSQKKDHEFAGFSNLSGNSLDNFEYDVKGTILFDKEKFKDYLFLQIQIKDPDNKVSFVNFDYFRDFNRLENISGRFEGMAIDKQYNLLNKFESISKGMGITEMRTKSRYNEFWDKTDWLKFPDGTYRKHLRPYLN